MFHCQAVSSAVYRYTTKNKLHCLKTHSSMQNFFSNAVHLWNEHLKSNYCPIRARVKCYILVRQILKVDIHGSHRFSRYMCPFKPWNSWIRNKFFRKFYQASYGLSLGPSFGSFDVKEHGKFFCLPAQAV